MTQSNLSDLLDRELAASANPAPEKIREIANNEPERCFRWLVESRVIAVNIAANFVLTHMDDGDADFETLRAMLDALGLFGAWAQARQSNAQAGYANRQTRRNA